jgi:hypothetical protein
VGGMDLVCQDRLFDLAPSLDLTLAHEQLVHLTVRAG